MLAVISNNLTNFVGACVAAGTICTALWTGFTYVNDIRIKFEASQEKIAALETSYRDLHAKVASLSAAGTVIGERGERGVQGVPGPKGDPGLTKIDVQNLIDRAFAQRPVATRPRSADVVASLSQQSEINKNSCIFRDKFLQSSSMVLRVGVEFCTNEGELINRIEAISKESIKIFTPGKGISWCNMGTTCQISWDEEKFYYIERINEDENSKLYALIRIKSKLKQ